MKSLIVLAVLAMSSQAFSEEVTCRSEKAIQSGADKMKADAEITFNLDRSTKEISKVVGHIFVQSPYNTDEEISIENSYMGFFSLEKVAANPSYRPIRYKGYTQFKEINAVHTAGLESGMWGAFVIDLEKSEKFDARYIFQAGDHMGGTVLFTCRSR